MANQSPDRRRVLEMIATAAAASQFPGFCRWTFAGEHQHDAAGPVQPRPANYRPQFFNTEEYETIERLTDIIIPADESPGATEAGVSEFIDFMAAHGDETLGGPLRSGLKWLDASAKRSAGKSFINLPVSQQIDLLKTVAYRNNVATPDAQGQVFFKLIRRYTVMGYYTSRIGLKELNYPGLKLYSQSPACPHTDDPEHRHLPAPRF
ncbi:MAG: gluconate 2-dehydrogenase subunit 3 family protein [Acidobacteriota bacterium]|nr:gluconate 2-dehydrogenase subunit 3 family protein [Acidobacteriota bacterium]